MKSLDSHSKPSHWPSGRQTTLKMLPRLKDKNQTKPNQTNKQKIEKTEFCDSVITFTHLISWPRGLVLLPPGTLFHPKI